MSSESTVHTYDYQIDKVDAFDTGDYLVRVSMVCIRTYGRVIGMFDGLKEIIRKSISRH